MPLELTYFFFKGLFAYDKRQNGFELVCGPCTRAYTGGDKGGPLELRAITRLKSETEE